MVSGYTEKYPLFPQFLRPALNNEDELRADPEVEQRSDGVAVIQKHSGDCGKIWAN
jgi:hypothetical protein